MDQAATTDVGKSVRVVFDRALAEQLEDWRRRQPRIPTIAEACVASSRAPLRTMSMPAPDRSSPSTHKDHQMTQPAKSTAATDAETKPAPPAAPAVGGMPAPFKPLEARRLLACSVR